MVFWCEYHGLSREVSRHTIRVFGTVDSIMIRRANAKSKVPEPKRRGREGR